MKKEEPDRYLRLEHWLQKGASIDPRDLYPAGSSKEKRRAEIANMLIPEVGHGPFRRLAAKGWDGKGEARMRWDRKRWGRDEYGTGWDEGALNIQRACESCTEVIRSCVVDRTGSFEWMGSDGWDGMGWDGTE